MKLIWTFSEKLKGGKVNSKLSIEQIFQLYKYSIECASNFYTTCVYTTKLGEKFFKGLVDEIKIIPEDFDYTFLADIKYYVIQNETPSYILIDGDLFIESELKISTDCDFGFEYEIDYDEDKAYAQFNKIFIREGIKDIIPYWKDDVSSFNLGLVYVNNTNYINDLCDDYNKVKKFYNEFIEPKYGLNKQLLQPSVTGAQYFFSLFCKHHKPTFDFFQYNNKFTHLSFKDKLKFHQFDLKKFII